MGIFDGSVFQPTATIRVAKQGGGDEEVDNPAYRTWIVQDQQLLAYLLSTMTKEILVQVSSHEHAASLWKSITEMFSSQSRSKILQLRSQLAREKKGDYSAAEYFSKMAGLADEMAAASKKIEDDDLIGYILNGLDSDYNPFVSSVSVKDTLSLGDLYSQLLSYEARLRQQSLDTFRSYSSANTIARDQNCGAPRGRGRGSSSGHGGSSGRGGSGPSVSRRQGSPSAADSDDSPVCQLCERTGHTVHDCWYRLNKKYVAPRDGGQKPIRTAPLKSASTAINSYGVDTNWYFDSGSTDHITNSLEQLSTRERYNGQEQIHAANGKGMSINHIGNTTFHTSSRDFSFNNVLHVPAATKNLISVHQFTSDNDVFLEFHPSFFCVKDLATKTPLLHGKCRDGLYPLQRASEVHHVTTPSSTHWHYRLGHLSSPIVNRVLRNHNLSYTKDHSELVCDACLQAKSHQLPYPKSVSESSFPLQLIFSDVWGPAPKSVGHYQYYVSFIDDFSKFTWIFFLKNRSDVYQVFLDFQKLVERQFNRKIMTMQTDWGGEYQKLNSFFKTNWDYPSCFLSSCSSTKWFR